MEAAQKFIFLVAGPLRGGGSYTGVPLRKKDFFLMKGKQFLILWPLSRGGG